MTSGSGDDRVAAMVKWIKSKLIDNANMVQAGLATKINFLSQCQIVSSHHNHLPESMHTGSQASLNCCGALLLDTHQALLNALPASMVACKAEVGLCCR